MKRILRDIVIGVPSGLSTLARPPTLQVDAFDDADRHAEVSIISDNFLQDYFENYVLPRRAADMRRGSVNTYFKRINCLSNRSIWIVIWKSSEDYLRAKCRREGVDFGTVDCPPITQSDLWKMLRQKALKRRVHAAEMNGVAIYADERPILDGLTATLEVMLEACLESEGKYEQRVKRLVDAARAFGLVHPPEDRSDRRIRGTAALHEMMLALESLPVRETRRVFKLDKPHG